MSLNKNIQHFVYLINIGILFVLGVMSIFPPIRSFSFFNQLWAVLLLGWFASITIAYPKFWFNNKVHRITIYGYIVYALVVANLTGNGVIGNRYFELFQIPLFFIAYYTYTQMGKIQACRRVVIGLIPFVLFTCIATIKACFINPFAARDTTSDLDRAALQITGVGGYEFIYFLVVAFAICLYFWNSEFKFVFKLGLALLIFLFFTTIVVSNFMTAFLLTTISVVIKVFLSEFKINNVIIFLLVVLFLFIFSDVIITAFIDVVLGLSGESLNAARLIELEMLFFENEQGVSMQARSNTYSESFEIIFEHPFFGILTKPLVRVGDGVAGFGQHSQILDTFALYGIPLGLVQLYIYFKPLLTRMMLPGGAISSFAFLIALLTGVIFTMNVSTPSIGFAIFFIFPVVYDYVNRKDLI